MSESENTKDMYLYALPKLENKILDVGIGTDCIGNISVDRFNSAASFTQKSIPNKISHSKFTIYHPTLPLGPPNNLLCKDLNDILRTSYFPTLISKKSVYHKQYCWFRSSHHNLLHKSLHQCTTNMLMSDSLKKYLNRNLPAVNHCMQYRKNMPSNLIKWYTNNALNMGILSDFISDIPKNILLEYTDESLFLDAVDLEQNSSLRNCLVMLKCVDRLFLVCASGIMHSDVVVKEIFVPENEKASGNNILLQEKEMAVKQLNYRVNEICYVGDSNFIVNIRGDYHDTLLDICISEDSVEIRTFLEFSFNGLIHSSVINPACHEEIMIVASDRSVTVFNGDSSNVKVQNDLFAESVQWQSCLYGNCQETMLVVTENDITGYDFRTPQPKTIQHLKLPCQYLNRVEKLSPAVSRSPLNLHHYVVTSDQSIIVNDERFLKTPVMKINHYMKHCPRHIDIMSLQDDSALITVASYQDSETVSMQICNNFIQDEHGMGYTRMLTAKEPLLTLSSPHDWTIHCNNWKLSLNNIRQRINQPLVGLAVSELDKSAKCLSCCIVQQTLAGDLFFQRFNYELGASEPDSRKQQSCTDYIDRISLTHNIPSLPSQLTSKYHEICDKWISNVVEMESCKEKHKKETAVNYEKIMDYEKQKLAQEGKNSYSVMPSQLKHFDDVDFIDVSNIEFQFCEIYNLEVCGKLKNQLGGGVACKKSLCFCSKCCPQVNMDVQGVKKMRVLNRKTLGLDASNRHLELIESPGSFPNPLSKVLLTNWNDETYTSLDVFAPNTAFDPDDNFESKKI